jgi:hypothetical protein
MDSSADYDLLTQPSLVQIKDKAAYRVALACLLFVWALFSLGTMFFVAAVLLPGHLGQGDLLQVLAKLLSGDPPIYGT